MDWSWDPAKANANRLKHGVSFDLAVLVFDDPMQLSTPDPHPDGDRWRTIGRVGVGILFVVHSWFDAGDGGRIISARRATPLERKQYEEGI